MRETSALYVIVRIAKGGASIADDGYRSIAEAKQAWPEAVVPSLSSHGLPAGRKREDVKQINSGQRPVLLTPSDALTTSPAGGRTNMANTQAKRSIPRKQSTHRNLPSTETKDPKQKADRRFVQFRETEGKTVETVELLTARDYHTLSINFRDKTCLHFSIETGFTVRTNYSDWKTGEQRTIRKWPLIRSIRSN